MTTNQTDNVIVTEKFPVSQVIDNEPLLKKVGDNWVSIFNELSFSGRIKNRLYQSFDDRFGEKQWIPAHFFEGRIVSRLEGYLYYEEGYYQFLKENPKVRKWIINTASDVYDIQPSNVQCGLDYTKQECDATHLQDISIRRALIRLHLEDKGVFYDQNNLPNIPVFKGDHLVQIRDHTTEGFILNPGQVPFHKPELGLPFYKKSWWKKDSVEDIYQRNKVLVVNKDALKLNLEFVTENTLFFAEGKNIYYQNAIDDTNTLIRKKGKEIRYEMQNGTYGNYLKVQPNKVQQFDELRSTALKIYDHLPVLTKKHYSFDELLDKIKGEIEEDK